MKKYIFTESQIRRIIDTQINEQLDIDTKVAINTASDEFLTKKGIKGKDLTEKILKYQRMIGCSETGHMMDCIDTMYEKNRKDFIEWKNLIQKNKPLIDKFGDLFFKNKDPKAIY